jgi:hypothetical protein
MVKAMMFLVLLALGACAAVPPEPVVSACSINEASYECQVERYRNVAH